MWRLWYVNVLAGASTTEQVAEVWACSMGSAFYKCRRAGYTPVSLFSGIGPPLDRTRTDGGT